MLLLRLLLMGQHWHQYDKVLICFLVAMVICCLVPVVTTDIKYAFFSAYAGPLFLSAEVAKGLPADGTGCSGAS
jgi:hypothetical protein